MVAGAVLTTTVDPSRTGAILTFVTPTEAGCGMACPYCFIDRRNEVTSGYLRPADYARFIMDAARIQPVAAVTIQGREPLEPGALPFTEAILGAARSIGAETGLVTNGLWLADAVPQLADWGCSGVTVSIDAGKPDIHDRLRRAPGAWRRAMDGLRLLAHRGSTAKVVVNSLVTRGAGSRLADLPGHLAEAGVTLWSLSPMLRFDAAGRASAAIPRWRWLEELRVLTERATACGVSVIADDEFSMMGDRMVPGVTLRTLARPQGLMRMRPDGRCTFGMRILDDEQAGACSYWRPGIPVSDVLRGLAQ